LKELKSSFLLAIAWFIGSTVLLTLPGSSFLKENWLDKLWIDKWVHIALIAIMVTLWCRVILKKKVRYTSVKIIFIYISLLCLSYGIGMEFIQKYFIPNRSFEVGDIVADAGGCILGAIFCISRYIKK
jgi:VanZ family protein